MNPTAVIQNKNKLIHLLKLFKHLLMYNNSLENKQGIAWQLLTLATYDNKLGGIIDTETTEEHIYPLYMVGKTEIIESNDNGETYPVTATTLLNTIDDILYDLE